MKVTKVSAEVQYSQAVSNGNGWKKVNLGAEATVTAKEDWRKAQGALYADLATQLKELFTNDPQQPAQKPDPKEKKAGNPGKTDPSWCPIHNCKMERREKNGGVWYSHKTKDGWCKGKAS